MTNIEILFNRLGIDIKDEEHPILQMIKDLSENNNSDKALYNEFYLKSLGIALYDIKEFDKRIFKIYKNRIIKQKGSFFGHAFEIRQGHHFITMSIKHNLSFKFGDDKKGDPDFLFSGFGFEITTSRFSDLNQNFDPGHKLLRAFEEKNEKGYATDDTALLVDITNISERVFGKTVNMGIQEFSNKVSEQSKFGVVIFFTGWLNNSRTNVVLVASKVIFSTTCNPHLRKMLEELFFHKNDTSMENAKILDK